MRIIKLENILSSGSFHSDISPEVALALKAKLKRSSIKSRRRGITVKPVLDFDEINKEAIKLACVKVKYPQKLPKGVVISVRRKSRVCAIK
jgi:hypothetical protein